MVLVESRNPVVKFCKQPCCKTHNYFGRNYIVHYCMIIQMCKAFSMGVYQFVAGLMLILYNVHSTQMFLWYFRHIKSTYLSHSNDNLPYLSIVQCFYFVVFFPPHQTRLQPLHTFKMDGPAIEKCQGIQPGQKSFIVMIII